MTIIADCFVNLLKMTKFVIMIEDPVLIEYRVNPLSRDKIVHAEDSEDAYALETVSHGSFPTMKGGLAKLMNIVPMSNTLGFEMDLVCDLAPYELITYNAYKTVNAGYSYGEHQPGGKRYSEPCKFQSGDKVLCLIHEGYDAVFPAIVVGPLTEAYLRTLYKTDIDLQIGYSSDDEVIEKWSDWNWDSVIVRPLVRLRNDWEEIGETAIVNRVYLFPYKKIEV